MLPWLLLFACAPKDAPPLAVLDLADRTDAPGPQPKDVTFDRAHLEPPAPQVRPDPPCPRLAPPLWSRVAEVTAVPVVVEGSWSPPAWFVMDAAVDSRAQGTVPGTRLCELAALPGVTSVEVVRTASPKEVR